MKYGIKRISWAATLAIAACMCTADTIPDNGQGVWDSSAHSVSSSADTDSGDNTDDEENNK